MSGYLFDTQILLWFLSGDDRLPKSMRKTMEDPSTEKYISIASAWEIAVKTSLGKSVIDGGVNEFWRVFIEGGFVELPISIEVIRILETLPLHHKDPFDRILVATAIAHKLELVTSDAELGNYFTKQP